MNVTLHKLLCFTLALLLASTPLIRAQQASITALAPIPPQITSAHTIFIANGGGTNYFNAFTGGADRGYSQLFTTLQQVESLSDRRLSLPGRSHLRDSCSRCCSQRRGR
jgi:hypothetical protein